MDHKPSDANANFDKPWHLANDGPEADVTALEHALMRSFEGFARWQASCLAALAEITASGPENTLLHLIRMQDTPKTITDLLRMTNRDDVPNVQYALRKLAKAGLICKQGSGRSGVTYVVTDEGRAVTDRYAALRRSLLMSEILANEGQLEDLRQATQTLNALSATYQKAAFWAEGLSRQTHDGI